MSAEYKVHITLNDCEVTTGCLDFDFFKNSKESCAECFDQYVDTMIEKLESKLDVGFSNIVVSVPSELISDGFIYPKKFRLHSTDEHVEIRKWDESHILIAGSRTPELKLTGKKVPLRTSTNSRAMIDFERAILQMSGFDVVRKCKQYLEMYMSKSDLRDWCKEKLKELES